MGHLHRHKLLAIANAVRDGTDKNLSRMEREIYKGAPGHVPAPKPKRAPAKRRARKRRKSRRRAS